MARRVIKEAYSITPLNILISAGFAMLVSACAGPTTPFGAVNTVTPDSRTEEEKNPTNTPKAEEKEEDAPAVKPIDLNIYPRRQKLHAASPLIIEIDGVTATNPENHLQIIYNGIDVTNHYLKRARMKKEDHEFKVVFDRLYLPSHRYNDIKVVYNEGPNRLVSENFFPPSCSVFDVHALQNTGPFNPPEQYTKLIELLAPRKNVNPAMLAGIVAQESAFDPKAVSWAKAIGLTQVTPLAETEIIENYSHFPRYPGLNQYSYPRIKTMIAMGKIDDSKEWRLNPLYSLQGGLSYLKYLEDYWSKEQNAKWLKTLPGDPAVVYSQVLLASYNSGAARVKYAISRNKERWLLDPKLKEAHKYVNKVFSYCYHFAREDEVRQFSTIKGQKLRRSASL